LHIAPQNLKNKLIIKIIANRARPIKTPSRIVRMMALPKFGFAVIKSKGKREK